MSNLEVSVIESLLENLSIGQNNPNNMNAEQVSEIVRAEVSKALLAQKVEFNKKITEIQSQITLAKPRVETYLKVTINPLITCDITLDAIKSLPEFSGNPGTYVSWREAAHNAYELFKRYDGSERHYQAVTIIRNKVRGAADAVLSSFNTVLNFNAIIARLDFTYADKRPIYLIEQEMSTLRQGSMSCVEFYDEVEKKLTLLTNKTIMSYEANIANTINEKYRADALRVFISGLKKPLCDILFASRPPDLPTALALAQEVDANNERYAFARNFANRSNDSHQNKRAHPPRNFSNTENNYGQKNPHYSNNPVNKQQASHRLKFGNNNPNQGCVEPMEVDPSLSQFKHTTNYAGQAYNDRPHGSIQKRGANSGRYTGPKVQRVNHLNEDDLDIPDTTQYTEEAEQSVEYCDELNFLRAKSLLPWIARTIGGRGIKLLIDTGASRSYIKPLPELKGIKMVKNSFSVKSIHGYTPIKHKCAVKIFGIETDFFILPDLTSFDGVIGLDVLNKIHASIDLKTNTITHDNGNEVILFINNNDINNLQLQTKSVPNHLQETFLKLICSVNGVFADPNESLPYNTNVVATIRTEDEDPVYSRLYPYPLAFSDFVNKEIQDLLANGIIRKSRSPYNNPIWVVKKRGLMKQGKRKSDW